MKNVYTQLSLYETELKLKEQQAEVQEKNNAILRGSLLAIIIGGLLLWQFLRYRNRIEKEREVMEKLRADEAHLRQLQETELRALRSQMNPHFIFNCLNAVKSLVLKNENDAASQYITKFSRLVRMVLENSRNEWISLEEELNILTLYLEIEQTRFNNGLQGIKAIVQHEPDIVFLDIEMPKMDGFQMLEALETINFTLVFTTAYDQFAVRAFKFSAFDYLLKPIDEEELIATIHKVELRNTPQKEHLELLKEHYKGDDKSTTRRIALSHSKGYQLVDSQAIMYCEADGNYAKVYLPNTSKVSVRKSLTYLEEVLDDLSPDEFFRIHRQYLVNLRFVKNYLNTEGAKSKCSTKICCPFQEIERMIL